MRFLVLALVLVGCEAKAPQEPVHEVATCKVLKNADDRNYCNGRCELVQNLDERADCFYWKDKNK